jgi:hypothetical protein
MQSTFDIFQIEQLQRRARRELQDPSMIMEAASRRVGKWFSMLEQRSNIPAAEVMSYLVQREPKIKQRLDLLWEAVDSDIQGRYLEGLLDEADFRAWRRNLHEWLALLHAAVALVRLHLSSDLESDLALPREIAQPALLPSMPQAAA